MAENKKSFLLYCDLIHTISKMPNDKAGELFKHILEYVNDNNPVTEDLIIQLTFEPIKQQLKRDLLKYKDISSIRSEIGKLAGIKSGEARRSKKNQSEPIGLKLNQNEQDKETDTVTDKDIVKDRGIDIVKERDKTRTRLEIDKMKKLVELDLKILKVDKEIDFCIAIKELVRILNWARFELLIFHTSKVDVENLLVEFELPGCLQGVLDVKDRYAYFLNSIIK